MVVTFNNIMVNLLMFIAKAFIVYVAAYGLLDRVCRTFEFYVFSKDNTTKENENAHEYE